MVFLLAMLAIMPKFWQRHLALALGNNQLSMAGGFSVWQCFPLLNFPIFQ
jgi:hypothetical protein